MSFAPATRKGTFVLIGITGESGTGKTYSALRIARGLVGPQGKIALIDTENGRGSMYDKLTPYDVEDLHAPFTPERYLAAVKEAEQSGFNCLIIDSFSHEWEGQGGVVEIADDSGGKGLQKWNQPKTRHKRLVNAMLQSRMHIIICMRGKEKMVEAIGADGKKQIVSAGIVPIQDKRFIFEMTVSLLLNDQTRPGEPITLKCPGDLRHLFPAGKPVEEAAGAGIREWVQGGQPVDVDLEQLLKVARDVATLGAKRLRQHLDSLTPAQRAKMKPSMTPIINIAQAADEEEEKASPPPPPSPPPPEYTPIRGKHP